MKRVHKIEAAAFAVAAVATFGAALFTTDASAAGYRVDVTAKTYNFPGYDRLNLRAWPAAHSRLDFKIKRGRKVFVERCIIKSGADWCLISQQNKPWKRGWANGRFFIKGGQNFASPHYSAYGWH